MVNSKGSAVIERDERSQRALATLGVVPDGRGQGEQALEDASHYATWGSASVTFEVELGLERGVDRFDELAQGLEEWARRPATIVLVGGSDELDAVASQEGLELFGAIPLIREDPLSGAQQRGLGLEEVPRHLALVDLGVGQREGDGQPRRRAHEMEPQSPKEARVTGAVALGGPPGEVTAQRRRSRASALDRRRVHDP